MNDEYDKSNEPNDFARYLGIVLDSVRFASQLSAYLRNLKYEVRTWSFVFLRFSLNCEGRRAAGSS